MKVKHSLVRGKILLTGSIRDTLRTKKSKGEAERNKKQKENKRSGIVEKAVKKSTLSPVKNGKPSKRSEAESVFAV